MKLATLEESNKPDMRALKNEVMAEISQMQETHQGELNKVLSFSLSVGCSIDITRGSTMKSNLYN